RKTFPVSNFPEFVNYVKKNSAKLQFGSAGAGTTTHLGCALLNAVIGVKVTHIPYRGGGPAVNDLMGGQIDYMCLNMGSAGTLSMGNQIKAIAMLSRSRSPLMPDLATVHEQGLRCRDMERLFSSERCVPRGRQKAQRCNEPSTGYAGD